MDYIEKIVGKYKNVMSDSEDATLILINAGLIYQALKKDEKKDGKELENAKKDLDELKIDYKGFTKNKLYLKHQSEMVNGIYKVLAGIKF